MRPLSTLRAKPALPVLNRPLIHWTLARLAACGVREVVINLHHLPDTVRAAVREGGSCGLRVRYSLETEILGTGGGPRRARRLLGNEPVLIVNGDVLFDFDLRRLVAAHQGSGARASLALRRNPNPRLYASVLTASDGRIVGLPGARRRARGRAWMFAGVHVVEPSLFERLPDGPSDSVRDLYAKLVDAGERVQGVPLGGSWYDLGTPELYRVGQLAGLRREWAGAAPRARGLVDHDARLGRGASVRRSVLARGVRVGAGARVVDSILWEGAQVGAHARVTRSVIAGGVVAAGARLDHAVVMPARLGAGRV
jgi:mannose-1-phosphate guanylyltransferase